MGTSPLPGSGSSYACSAPLPAPFSSNAFRLKMIGIAPMAALGRPAIVVAVVVTFHERHPEQTAEVVLVRAADVHREGPARVARGVRHGDRGAVGAVGVAVRGRDRLGGRSRRGGASGRRIRIGGGERRGVGDVLLVAALDEGRAAVEDQPGHRHDRDQRQGEDHEDLAALAAASLAAALIDHGRGRPGAMHGVHFTEPRRGRALRRGQRPKGWSERSSRGAASRPRTARTR